MKGKEWALALIRIYELIWFKISFENNLTA